MIPRGKTPALRFSPGGETSEPAKWQSRQHHAWRRFDHETAHSRRPQSKHWCGFIADGHAWRRSTAPQRPLPATSVFPPLGLEAGRAAAAAASPLSLAFPPKAPPTRQTPGLWEPARLGVDSPGGTGLTSTLPEVSAFGSCRVGVNVKGGRSHASSAGHNISQRFAFSTAAFRSPE